MFTPLVPSGCFADGFTAPVQEQEEQTCWSRPVRSGLICRDLPSPPLTTAKKVECLKPRSIRAFNAQTLSWMRRFPYLVGVLRDNVGESEQAYETRAIATIFEYEAA